MPTGYQPQSVVSYSISKCDSISDLLEVNILLKEAGLWRAGSPPTAAVMAVPLFETIEDLQRAFAGMTEWLGLEDVTALTRARGLT